MENSSGPRGRTQLRSAGALASSVEEPVDEKIAEVQTRVNLLVGDKKAYFETVQSSLHIQRDQLQLVKDENTRLKETLTKLRIEAGGMQGKKGLQDIEMDRLEDDCHQLRKQYDNLRFQVKKKEHGFEKLKNKMKAIHMEAGFMGEEENATTLGRLRSLENRLDKMMIKNTEAHRISKTYGSIYKKMQDERLNFENQIASMQRLLANKSKELGDLTLMASDAAHARDTIRAEVSNFRAYLEEERRMRETQLADRREYALKQIEQSKQMQRHAERERKRALRSDPSKIAKEKQVVHALRANMHAKATEAHQKKIDSFETAFKKIKDATGIRELKEVVAKFLTQEATYNGLLETIREEQRRIEELQEERRSLRSTLEDIQFSGFGFAGSRRVTDEFENHLEACHEDCERNRSKCDRALKLLANAKAGLEHLITNMKELDGPELPVGGTQNVMEVVNVLQTKYMKLLDNVDEAAQPPVLERKESFDGIGYGPYALARSHMYNANMKVKKSRVRLVGAGNNAEIGTGPAPTEEKKTSDSEDESEDENILDRNTVKRLAMLTLEKHKKKKKRSQSKGNGGLSALASKTSALAN